MLVQKKKVAPSGQPTIVMQAPPAHVQVIGINLKSLKQGSYQILGLLGQGGMARVYQAKTIGGQKVAIKELETTDRELIEMFERERDIMKQLKNDDHFPALIDYFTENNKYYLVMEFIDGQTLEDLLNSTGPLPEDRVIKISLEILEALGILHKLNLVYRDLKPKNIMLTIPGKVKLIDFGITREKIDRRNTVIGTPGYAPPEQYSGKAESRSDLYSLGKTIYALLTNYDVNSSGFDLEPVRVVNPAVSRSLEALIIKATEATVKLRYASAVEMKKALLKIEVASSHQVPRIGWVKWGWDNCRQGTTALSTHVRHSVLSMLLLVVLITTFFTGLVAKNDWLWLGGLGGSGTLIILASWLNICPVCALLNLFKALPYSLINLLILVANLGLAAGHQLGCFGRQVIKRVKQLGQGIIKWRLIRNWRVGTWQDARNFLLETPWPYATLTIAGLALWTLGLQCFDVEVSSWFLATSINLFLLGTVMFWVCEISSHRLTKIVRVVLVLLSALFVSTGFVSIVVVCSRPSFILNYDSNNVVVGQPTSFYWQLNNMSNVDQFFLVLPQSGKKIRLKPNYASHCGGFTATFSREGNTTLRLMAIDRKNKEMYDQVFVVVPAREKAPEPEYQDNIKI